MKNIIFENVSFGYEDRLPLVFENVNLSFSKGNIYSVFGENSSGKSTFLFLLSGIYKPCSGKVKYFFNGKECNADKVKTSFFYQDYRLNFSGNLNYLNISTTESIIEIFKTKFLHFKFDLLIIDEMQSLLDIKKKKSVFFELDKKKKDSIVVYSTSNEEELVFSNVKLKIIDKHLILQ